MEKFVTFPTIRRSMRIAASLRNKSNVPSYLTAFQRCMHLHQQEDADMAEFRLLEYKSGPSTADKIILQADKFGASLVVCVSSDFEMNRGLAKYFKKTLQHAELFKGKAVTPGQAAIIPYRDSFIYYLVTREGWWDRGCYRHLKSALKDVKEHAKDNCVTNICMGRLGSGPDGLDWTEVKEIIKDTFQNSNLTITAQITR
eukprot:Seg2197.4 transcript_id=Seg2197.4/GoldUCD/mRNA.D3Y31 product="O-acetyl-ADP-ribose deacetylase 1" protein_id=Seg2197.4/GoldUCD/D3Y31